MRRAFAPLLVATAVTPACRDDAERPPPPRPRPPDARVAATPPPDAAPRIVFEDPQCFAAGAPADRRVPVECPDDVLPEAPAGATTIDDAGVCWVYPIGNGATGRVRCPPDGATLTISEARLEGFRFDTYNMTCWQGDPPAQEQVRCPAALLPVLHPKLTPTVRDGLCSWQAGSVGLPVACAGVR